MIILRKFREPGEQWEKTTIEECIEHTEGCGYWKKGGVLKMLQDGLVVWTPFAEYKIN